MRGFSPKMQEYIEKCDGDVVRAKKMYKSDYMKEYMQKNQEQLNEYRKNYAKEHKEVRQKYYQEHKADIYANQTEYRHKNSKKVSQMVYACRKRRYEKLKEQGVCNAWGVLNYGQEPRYEYLKRGRKKQENE